MVPLGTHLRQRAQPEPGQDPEREQVAVRCTGRHELALQRRQCAACRTGLLRFQEHQRPPVLAVRVCGRGGLRYRLVAPSVHEGQYPDADPRHRAQSAGPANTPTPQYVGLASAFRLATLNLRWDTQLAQGIGLRLDGDYIRNLAYDKQAMFSRATTASSTTTVPVAPPASIPSAVATPPGWCRPPSAPLT